MMDNLLFYTASMAKLCAEQGYFEKSAEIYQYLLQSDPENGTLRQALAGVQASQAAVTGASGSAGEELERLEPMIKKWVELMVEHDLKSKFDKIRKSVESLRPPGDKT